jgi:hypothetical protein
VAEYYHDEDRHHANHLEDSELAIKVVAAFLEQLSKMSAAHIIVDGLDECSNSSAALKLFDSLIKIPVYKVDAKWFFTSRPNENIRQFMQLSGAISIQPPPGSIREDIALDLDRKMHGGSRALISCPHCVQDLTATSEENFLYSKIMFEILCGKGLTCSDELHEELRRFPKTMSGCWMRCLEDIIKKSEREQDLMRQVFAPLSLYPNFLY